MPRKPGFLSKLEQLRPRKPEGQIPVGWWQDAKGRSQPPGSYLDPSLRVDSNGSPVGDAKG
jgi:hypothetical protein